MKTLIGTSIAGAALGLQIGHSMANDLAPTVFAMTLAASAAMGGVVVLAIGSLLYSLVHDLNRTNGTDNRDILLRH